MPRGTRGAAAQHRTLLGAATAAAAGTVTAQASRGAPPLTCLRGAPVLPAAPSCPYRTPQQADRTPRRAPQPRGWRSHCTVPAQLPRPRRSFENGARSSSRFRPVSSVTGHATHPRLAAPITVRVGRPAPSRATGSPRAERRGSATSCACACAGGWWLVVGGEAVRGRVVWGVTQSRQVGVSKVYFLSQSLESRQHKRTSVWGCKGRRTVHHRLQNSDALEAMAETCRSLTGQGRARSREESAEEMSQPKRRVP